MTVMHQLHCRRGNPIESWTCPLASNWSRSSSSPPTAQHCRQPFIRYPKRLTPGSRTRAPQSRRPDRHHRGALVTTLLALEDVSVKYVAGTQPAVSGIDLRVDAVRTGAARGPSGCGKSTLMRVINGLVRMPTVPSQRHCHRRRRECERTCIREISETIGTCSESGQTGVGHAVLADLAFGLETGGTPPTRSSPASMRGRDARHRRRPAGGEHA